MNKKEAKHLKIQFQDCYKYKRNFHHETKIMKRAYNNNNSENNT